MSKSNNEAYLGMKESYRIACTEALLIVAAAILLSLLFSGIKGKGLFSASPSSSSPPPPEATESTFLNFENALGLHLRKQALFIDARSARDYSMGHIPGAVNVPLHEFDPNHPILSALPKDHMLVVYCDGEQCSSSVELAKRLYGAGFSNVKIFFGGWNEWLAHKQPTEP